MSQLTDDTANRVAMLVARGHVALVDDDKKMQQVQARILSKEAKDGIEHFQPYGFTSNPKPGAEVLLLSIGGNRDHVVAVMVDDRRYRLRQLEAGDVALYTDEGTSVVLKRGKVIEVTCDEYKLTCKKLTIDASESIKVTSPSVDVNES